MEHEVVKIDFSGKKTQISIYRARDTQDLIEGLKSLTPKNTTVEDEDFFIGRRALKPDWHGASEKSQVTEMLRHGTDNKEMIMNVGEYAKDVKGGTPILRYRGIAYRNAGCIPCVSRCLSGNPNCMIVPTKKKSQKKIISIAVNSAVRAGVSISKYRKIGSVIARAIIDLETAGYRIRLNAIDLTYNYHDQILAMSVLVKGENEPMNIQRMLYPVCEMSFPRVVGFTMINRADDWRRENSLGLVEYRCDDGDREKVYNAVTGGDCVVLAVEGIERIIDEEGDNDEVVKKVVKMILEDKAAGNYYREK